VNGKHLLDGLEFDDELGQNHEIHSIPAVERHTLVGDGKLHLSLERELPQGELTSEARLVRGLEQTRTEGAVDLDTSPDDRP
jgi:hypothetical protein